MTMPVSENDGSEPISRENFTRLYGGASIAGGVILLLVVWATSGWVGRTVAQCNTVAGDLYGRSHPKTGAACAVANFADGFHWIFIILAVILVIVGVIAVIGANNPDVREGLDLD